MTNVVPIPTEYKGVTFRSRLEENWAEYFDFAGFNWVYEPEGYQLPNGMRYLPDFHIRQPSYRADALIYGYVNPETGDECHIGEMEDLFVECKGPITDRLEKAGYFMKYSGCPLVVAFPMGRFFFCGGYDNGDDLLINNDWAGIERNMKNVSSLAMIGPKAFGGPKSYFWDGGAQSDMYVGDEPDWCCSPKDRRDRNGRDVMTNYYAGFSTWELRGFRPSQWHPPHPPHPRRGRRQGRAA